MNQITSQNIIFIIAAGVLTFVILFIFAKRQISRFALRSRRGPHVSIGTDAKKCLKRSIERRIEAVPRIMHEPRLLSTEPSHYILAPQQPYHYRFRAVDDLKTLEDEICRHDPNLRRHPSDSVRRFLKDTLAGALNGLDQKLVQEFCDTYEYARYHPGEFGYEEYKAYNELLLKLLDAARLLSRIGTCRGSSPRPQAVPFASAASRLLDVARLRPMGKPTTDAPRLRSTVKPTTLHKRYTTLENTPADFTIENDEIIRVPKGPNLNPNYIITNDKPPADETAV